MISRSLKLTAVIALLATIILWPPVFGWHRPYVNWAPWNLAAYLAEHQRPAADCMDLIYFQIMSPSQAEQRALCVHEYAKLTKDPTACELLMPSSYGLSCVGAATSTDDFCHFYDGDENVYWDEADDTFGKIKIGSCQYNDPTASDKRNQCCLIARIRYVSTENNCSGVAPPSLQDECLNALAFKNHNPSVCADIENENRQSACTVRAAAMQKDPSICQGCKKPVERLEDLK